MNMKVHFLLSTSFSLMHIAKIHVTHCLLWHVYAFTYSYDLSSHDCIHVGGANACFIFFQSFTCYTSYRYLELWCMLSSITNKGEIESTSAPWVILVINVNISFVGLILLPSIFQMSSTLEWQGKRMWNPFKMLRTNIGKISILYIFIFVIQDNIETIGKRHSKMYQLIDVLTLLHGKNNVM